jgi:hypothetical protein
MKFRTLIGLLLVLVGGGIALYGVGMAVMELVHLYGSALNDPLADTPGPGAEQGVADRMIRDAIIGGCGVVPLIIGSMLLKVGMIGALVRMVEGKSKPESPSAPPRP